MLKRLTKQEFIEKARAKHGCKYDYSKVEYINNHTKVCIICPEHGEFWQTPMNHLMGKGCVKCVRPNSQLSTEKYIAMAKETHGGVYDYSKTVYGGMSNIIIATCIEHGDFEVSAQKHLKGQGCPKCKQKQQYKRINKYARSEDDYLIKDIKGYEGLYKVTNDGRVYSVRKKDWLLPSSTGGYMIVNLWKDGTARAFRVHRLVAEAFIPNPHNKPQVNHLDENPSNNRMENLEWATAEENIQWGTRTEREIQTKRKKARSVLQFTKDGKFIKEWSCANEAIVALGYKTDKIGYCCKGARKTFMGYIWRYKEYE